jgi:hypothetical protein
MTNPRLTKFEVNKPSSMTCGRNPPLPWHGDSPSAIRDIWADVVAKPKACGTARSHFGIALGWLVYELTTPMNRCMKIGCLPKKQKNMISWQYHPSYLMLFAPHSPLRQRDRMGQAGGPRTGDELSWIQICSNSAFETWGGSKNLWSQGISKVAWFNVGFEVEKLILCQMGSYL